MRMLATVHLVLGGKQVIHAPDLERHVAVFFQGDEHAALIAMLLQLDSLDLHGVDRLRLGDLRS
jgi:hypothetical protein